MLNASTTPIKRKYTKKYVHFCVLHTIIKCHQSLGNNKKVMTTILPISTSIDCPENFQKMSFKA